MTLGRKLYTNISEQILKLFKLNLSLTLEPFFIRHPFILFLLTGNIYFCKSTESDILVTTFKVLIFRSLHIGKEYMFKDLF